MSEPIDIGHGVSISFAVNADGVECGVIERHPGKNGQTCSGYVAFRGIAGWQAHAPADDAPSWIVESREPLTLSPSVLCRTCGHHGFIRGGRWVPA